MRPCGRRATTPAAVVLCLLPLAYTAGGFVPGRTLAPTRLFVGVAPWADPDLVSSVQSQAGPSNPVLLDPVSQMIPWSRAARDHLLINPAQGAGAALLGNGQSAVLFPTEVLSRLLAPFRAVTYSQAARLLIAAWGVFLLVRFLGAGEIAACAAAIVFTGSGFVQLWRLHPHSLVAATAPWILAGLVSLWREPGPRSTTLLAIAGAAGVAAGHPETLLHVSIFALLALWGLCQLQRSWIEAADEEPSPSIAEARDHERGRRLRARVTWGLACALLATLLAAPVLFPVVETLRASMEWLERRPLGRTNVETTLDDMIDRLQPAGALFALGDPVAGTWRGPENLAELGGGATGGTALFLAALALLAPADRRRRVASWSIAGIGLLGAAVGAHMPILSTPFSHIPLLGDTLLKRLSLWWVLAVTLLAAAGVQAIVTAGRGSRRLLGSAVGAALLSSLLVLLAIDDPPGDRATLWLYEGAPILAALAATIVFASRSGLQLTVVRAAVLVAVLLVPRVVLFDRWVPQAPADAFYPGTPALRVLLDRLSALPPHGFRVTGLESTMPPHSGAFYGLEEIRAYDPMTFAAYERFVGAVIGAPSGGWARILDPRNPALDFLGVRFVLDDSPRSLSGDRAAEAHAILSHRRRLFVAGGFELVHEGSDALVWERREALPRAFLPQAWKVVSPALALAEAASIRDFAALTIVDRGAADSGASVEGRLDPSARVLALDVHRDAIRAEVTTSTPSLLATSQPAIPGWRLTIDGERAPDRLRRVNTAFLGVALPPGRHRVDLHYAPFSWRLGLLLGALGAMAMILLWISGRARRPRW